MPRKKMAEEKSSTSIRLTAEGKRLLETVAEAMGVSQSAAMEIAVRLLAKREKVE